MARGNYESAHNLLEEGDEDDVLYLLEKGLLSHYAGLFNESNDAFERAEVLAEDLYTKSISREAAALLTSDLVLSYAGSDMERVMINFYRALNYINLGLYDDVLVEGRKINEKLEVLRAEREGGRSYCDDPYLQYITGLLYEWGGEPNDAFISYREAHRFYPQFNKRYGVVPPPTLKCDIERTANAIGISPWGPEEGTTPYLEEGTIPDLEKEDPLDQDTGGAQEPDAGAASEADMTDEAEPDGGKSSEVESAREGLKAGADDAAGEMGRLAADENIAPVPARISVGEDEAVGEEGDLEQNEPSVVEEPLRRIEKPCVQNSGHGEVVLFLELGFIAHKDELVLHIPILEDETSLAEAHDEDFFFSLSDRATGYDVGDREVAYILSLAVPYYAQAKPLVRLGMLTVGQIQTETSKTQDLSAIATRHLDETMPRILAKTAARAVTKYLAKKGAEKKWGKLSGALVDIMGTATEHADTRSWLSLPSEIHLARLSLPAGTYQASLDLLGWTGDRVERVDFGEIHVVERDVTFLFHRAP
jgi:tetratricopeptide (TPR) repeat protein